MNPRIQELIRQSAVPADQAEDYALAKGLIEPAEKLDVAKFAELIVRECADVGNDSNQSKNRAVGVSVGDVIRKHFGVES